MKKYTNYTKAELIEEINCLKHNYDCVNEYLNRVSKRAQKLDNELEELKLKYDVLEQTTKLKEKNLCK